MKRLLSLFCMVSAWLTMQAANTITVTGGTGHPGDEVTVSVAMTGTDAVTALELQLPLGEWLEYVDGSCTLNADRSDGHTIYASSTPLPIGEGAGVGLRIYMYSLGLRALRGTSGEVLSFRLRLGEAPGTFTLSPTVLASNASGTTVATEATAGTATIQCPALRVITEQIDFGHVPIRSQYEGTLTLQNYGNEPLTISNVIPNNSELAVSPATLTIPAGSSASTTITYSPLKRVPFAATLTIESDAVNAKVYNRWQTAQVVADPYSVNELHVVGAAGASDTEVEIALRMNNMEPIVGAQVSLRLPEALKYVAGSATMTARSDGHSITATTGDDNTLTLFVYSATNKPLKGDDGDICTFRVALQGQSGWYWLSPQNVILSNATMENMTSATSGDYAQIQSPTISAATSLAFGRQDATQPLTATYSIRNTGQTPLVIERATFLADGFSITTPLPLTIEPYTSGDLGISYAAAKAGSFATTMNVYSNDPATRVKGVAVSGTAFSPNELTLTGHSTNGSCHLDISLCNDAELTAVQFTLTPSQPIGGDATVTPTARLASHTANIYPMDDGTWKVLVFSMTNATISGHDGELLGIEFDGANTSHDITFTLIDVVLSSKDGTNMLSPVTTLPQSVTLDAVQALLGDTNNDGVVNVTDCVNLINYLHTGSAAGVFDAKAADVNSDGILNITDVVGIIEIIKR